MKLSQLFNTSPRHTMDAESVLRQRRALSLNVAKSQAINCTDPNCAKHAEFSYYLRHQAGVLSSPYTGSNDWKDPLIPCTTIMRLEAEAEHKVQARKLAKKSGTGKKNLLLKVSLGRFSTTSSRGDSLIAATLPRSDAAANEPRSSTSSTLSLSAASILTTASSSSSTGAFCSPRESPRAVITLQLQPLKAAAAVVYNRVVGTGSNSSAAQSPLAASATTASFSPAAVSSSSSSSGPYSGSVAGSQQPKARRASAPGVVMSASLSGGPAGITQSTLLSAARSYGLARSSAFAGSPRASSAAAASAPAAVAAGAGTLRRVKSEGSLGELARAGVKVAPLAVSGAGGSKASMVVSKARSSPKSSAFAASFKPQVFQMAWAAVKSAASTTIKWISSNTAGGATGSGNTECAGYNNSSCPCDIETGLVNAHAPQPEGNRGGHSIKGRFTSCLPF